MEKQRVLVAEDNEFNRRVMLAFLDRLGYAWEVAVDGQEVLDAVSRDEFDLVLMDIRMPRMNGLEVSRRIREMGSSIRQPKIVAVSAGTPDEGGRSIIEAGVDHFLPKPLKMADLGSSIAAALDAA